MSQNAGDEATGNNNIGFDALEVMLKALPSVATIDDECRDLVNDQVQEFLRIIYSHARSLAILDKRGDAVNGSDIVSALVALGMENHAEALNLYLEKYKAGCSVSVNSICDNS